MLEIDDLTKQYGGDPALDGLSLTVADGEFVTLLGPSGSGKTTALLAVAGHVTPTAGQVRIDGEDVTDAPPEERSLGVVFQHDALFPHMTARENVTYALGPHGFTATERERRTDEFLSLVGLSGEAGSYPDQLSGGQRRRIELARALVYEPDVLLLDEPLTGLDRKLRREMRSEIARIHRETGVTTLYVTHDQEEALTLADRLAVLDDGRIAGSGQPGELYERPPNRFVASFLGSVSTLPATVAGTDPAAVEWCGYRFELDGPIPEEVGDRLRLYLRPEAVERVDERSSTDREVTVDESPSVDREVTVDESPSVDREVTVDATVVDLAHSGPRSTIHARAPDGSSIRLTADGFPAVEPGEPVAIGFDAGSLFAFAADRRLSILGSERR